MVRHDSESCVAARKLSALGAFCRANDFGPQSLFVAKQVVVEFKFDMPHHQII